jgi:hypothetical protein
VIGHWERVLVLAPHTDDGEFGCGDSRSGEGAGGNREVPPSVVLGARVEGNSEEEGGPWGKHGFPHAKEPSSEVSL